MNPRISILYLPGETSFLHGKYGLERCIARGIVRIHLNSATFLKCLKIGLSGTVNTHIWDSLDSRLFSMKRRKVLFQEEVILLENFECTDLRTKWFDIPFELMFPKHDEITFGFGPCSQLLPCSIDCSGKGGWKDDYEANIEYSLTATLSQPSSIPFVDSRKVDRVVIAPFLIWDPRLLQLIMHTEERKWKSHVGAKPVEYEIEVGSMVFGPNDVLKFSYRMLVNSHFSRCGIRIRRVHFILKEYHWVGEDRCCIKDDQHDWGHGRPFRVRGQRELCRWSQVEFPPTEQTSPTDLNLSYPSTDDKKYDGLAIFNRKFPGNDGIYVERRGSLHIPSLEDFNPSTARPLPPANDNVCNYERPRKAFVAIRHTLTCMIEMRGSDTISIEAGCYLAGVGYKDCTKLLDSDPDILPTLDYQKMSGISELDHWVPNYEDKPDICVQEKDSFHTANDLSRDDILTSPNHEPADKQPKDKSLQIDTNYERNMPSPKNQIIGQQFSDNGLNESVEIESVLTRDKRKSYNSSLATSMGRVIVSPLDPDLIEENRQTPPESPPDYYHDDLSQVPRLRYPNRDMTTSEILDLSQNRLDDRHQNALSERNYNLEDTLTEAMDSTFF